MKLITILILCAVAVGCGYGSHSTMPPAPGTMPVIASLAPNNATAGGAAFMLTVTGSSFNSNAVVNFANQAMTTSWTSSSMLTANIPASAIATSGTVQVTVTNPGKSGGIYGGGTKAATSSPVSFTIN